MGGSEVSSAPAVPVVQRRVEEILHTTRADVPVSQQLETLASVGALSLLQAGRWGGLEASPLDFSRMVRAIAERSASLGWMVSQLSLNNWQTALFAEEVQAEVWGEGSNQRIAAARAPLGRIARRAGGDCLLSGQWRRCVGADAARWLLLAAWEADPEGRPLDLHLVLVSADEVSVSAGAPEVGLGGVAPLTVTAEQVVVPARRVLRLHDVHHLRAPGRRVNSGPLHAVPWPVIFGESALAPLLGAVLGAQRAATEGVRQHTELSLGGVSDSDGRLRSALAKLAATTDMAVAQTERNLVEAFGGVAHHGELDDELRQRVRRDQVWMAEHLVAATDMLFSVRSRLPDPARQAIETSWRDVHTVNQHLALDPEPVLHEYGNVMLGREVREGLE